MVSAGCLAHVTIIKLIIIIIIIIEERSLKVREMQGPQEYAKTQVSEERRHILHSV